MELTGWPFATIVALLAVSAPAGLLLLWGRVQGVVGLRVAQRLGLVLWCQLTAVLLTGVLVNNQFALYESWDDLLGSGDNGHDVQVQAGPEPSASPQESGAAATSAAPEPAPRLLSVVKDEGAGRILSGKLSGQASKITSKIWVLLPTGYNAPENASRQYPVVMFLPGYPGTPTTWLHALNLQQVMDAEVSSGKVQPFIAVLPTMNVAAPRDTECVNVPNGPQVATWLAKDVPQVVSAEVRALPLGSHWGVTGYSTGGFCAVKLALTYPGTFTSAAVLSGYFSPSNDVTTGDLFGGSEQLRQQNDPQWLVSHAPPPAVRLLTVWSAQDPGTAGPTQTFLAAARSKLPVDEIRLAKGGHNTSVWLGVLPRVLEWLSDKTKA